MTPSVAAIGEAMVEFAPDGDGRYRCGVAGDTYNTIWHIAQLLGDRARCGFVTRVGCDRLSNEFVAEDAADGLETSGVLRDPVRTMGGLHPQVLVSPPPSWRSIQSAFKRTGADGFAFFVVSFDPRLGDKELRQDCERRLFVWLSSHSYWIDWNRQRSWR